MSLVPDGGETTAVRRVPLTPLGSPDTWRELAPPIGWQGRVIDLPEGMVWGYTADILAALIRAGHEAFE